ncbi:MAG: phage integrase SAM-like domain-containing protein, partial [Rhodospirillales bacterium]
MKASKSRHNPTDITTIKGYPETLKLFRMPASKYWYVRMYIRGGPSSGVKKSTRCEKLNEAKEFAINWYEERLLEKRRFADIGAENFETYSRKFQDRQKRQINRGELNQDMFKYDKLKLDKDILPTLGHIHIAKIDYNSVDIFIDELRTERNLSVSSLKKYIVCIRKVLKEAEKEGIIIAVPSLPTIKTGNVNPRPWFSPEEYKRLLDACRDLRDNP